MFIEFTEVVPEVFKEKAVLSRFRAHEFQNAVHSIAPVGDAFRATPIGVCYACGVPFFRREAHQMPPPLAGETDMEGESNISGMPGVVISILADHTASVGLATNAIVCWLW